MKIDKEFQKIHIRQGMLEFNEEYPGNPARPSYIQIETLHPRIMADFSISVVKKLSDEFKDDDIENIDKGKIKTFLRIRPSKEIGPFVIKDEKTLAVLDNNKRTTGNKRETLFTFTKILSPESTQIQVFDECVSSMLERLFKGESCLIFGYGATNSGKTHTMQGYGSDFGIVPRTLEVLFNRLEDKLYLRGDIKPLMFEQCLSLSEKDTSALQELKARILRDVKIKQSVMDSFCSSFRPSMCGSLISSGSGGASINYATNSIIDSKPISDHNTIPDGSTLYCIWVSFAELYNDKIYDLFEHISPAIKKRKELKMMADHRGHVYIKDLTEVCVISAEEAYKLFLAGKSNLHFAVTQMNSTSSRSHCFFNIRVVTVGTTKGNVYPKKVHRISFCDLAGAERASQTGNVGSRLKESGNINQSLLVLLRCIRAMRDQQSKGHTSNEFVPFRENKLTRLFQSYLTTASHISMIVNINPDPKNYESTFQVLQNSAVASEVIAFQKVQPPKNNSKFYRKVRESISKSQSIAMSITNEISEDAEECESEYECQTVVSKPKAKPVINKNEMDQCIVSEQYESEYIRQLEIHNINLQQLLQDREDENERLKDFIKLLEEQDKEADIQSKEYISALDDLNQKRLSLQAQMLRDDHERELRLFKETMMAEAASDDYVSFSEGEYDEHEESTKGSKYKTPQPPSFSKVVAEKNQIIKNQESTINELNEAVDALQKWVDAKKGDIAHLQIEVERKDAHLNDIIGYHANLLRMKDEEIERLTSEEPNSSEELLLQVDKLMKEVERLSEENCQLKSELEDGQSTCVQYDRQLSRANETIESTNAIVNNQTYEIQRLKEELDVIHYSYEIMDNKLKKYAKNDRGDRVFVSTGTVTSPSLNVRSALNGRVNKRRVNTPLSKPASRSKKDVSVLSKTKSKVKAHKSDSFEISFLSDDEEYVPVKSKKTDKAKVVSVASLYYGLLDGPEFLTQTQTESVVKSKNA